MTLKDKFLEQTLAIDFGNSSAKILYKNIYKTFKYTENFEGDFQNFFFQKVRPPLRVLYSSVNVEQSNKVINFLASQQNVYVYNTREIILKQKKINVSNYHWIGTDRILGLIGALEEFAPPLVTIDIGTATTINCVDENRNFVGGLIFAGPETQKKALEKNTFLLKNINWAKEEVLKILETSTELAISSGIINSIWGGILYILNEIQANYFKEETIPVVITGGGFEYFKIKFQNWDYPKKYYRKNLVLSGIIALAKSEKQYLIEF